MSRWVLVLDDDAEFRRAIVPVLERRGLRVLEAGTAAEATAAVASRAFSLLIVDGLLPDANGVTWLTDLRKRGDETPAIYITAFPHELKTVKRLTAELAVAQVIYKPIIPSVFGALVDQILDGQPEPVSSRDTEPSEIVPPDMRDDYGAALPKKVRELEALVARVRDGEREAWIDARRLAHNLRGTAGIFGFERVGEAAARIDEGLRLVAVPSRKGHPIAWAEIDRAVNEATELAEDKSLAPMVAATARILVADSDADSRRRLVELGREHCVHVTAVDSIEAALAKAKAEPFDAALIDVLLAPADQGVAFKLARDLRSLPGHERLPLSFMSADGTVAHRVAAAHAGGSLYLAKPIDAYVFSTAVQQLLALRHSDRTRVLIVDDDEDFCACLAAVLAEEGMAVTTLTDPSRIVEVAEEQSPDLVLLDVMLPGVSGFDIARLLRTTPRFQDVPILFLTGRTDLESRIAAFDAGGDDYLAKPIVEEELLARVRVRIERRKLLREMTEKDPLTKLLSRRALLEALAIRLSESRRHARRLSIALLDVDKFKDINDTHGHLIGDQVLAALGQLLGERFRLEDLRGRWGGEEFVIVFPGETADTVAGVLRRVLAEFRQMAFHGGDGGEFHVTLSGGVATFPEDGGTVEALLKSADRRLYQAKERGRNRVIAPSPDGPPSGRISDTGKRAFPFSQR